VNTHWPAGTTAAMGGPGEYGSIWPKRFVSWFDKKNRKSTQQLQSNSVRSVAMTLYGLYEFGL
jgi:hypothetical protein